jgi:hypothetical protein
VSFRIALHYAEELDQTTRNELEQLVIALQTQLPNASLFTTGTLDPDVLPPGTIGGPPAKHAPTHEPGGSDPMTVNAAPTVGSLRTLGTGPNEAAPGNDARFAAGMDLDYLGAYAPGTYNDGDIVVGADGIAYLCVKDGTTTPPEAWPGAQTPVLHHATHEPGGTDELANAAWTNVANVFTANPQSFAAQDGATQIHIRSTAQPADARLWNVYNAGNLIIRALNDAGTVAQANALQLTRAGDAAIGRDVYEKGRVTPMGHWIDVAFSAGNFVYWTITTVRTNRYTLIGKTMIWELSVVGTVTTAGPQVIAIPPFPVTNLSMGGSCGRSIYNGAWGAPLNWETDGTGLVLIRSPRLDAFNINAGTIDVIATMTFELA